MLFSSILLRPFSSNAIDDAVHHERVIGQGDHVLLVLWKSCQKSKRAVIAGVGHKQLHLTSMRKPFVSFVYVHTEQVSRPYAMHSLRDLVLAVCRILYAYQAVCSCNLRMCDSREYYRRVSYWETGTFYWMNMLRCCVVKISSVAPVETCLLRWCLVLGRFQWDTPAII